MPTHPANPPMTASNIPPIPSTKKLKLLVWMYRNDDFTTFKTQKIYVCNRSFKRAMCELHVKGLILKRQMFTGNEYKLSDNGRILAGILNGS